MIGRVAVASARHVTRGLTVRCSQERMKHAPNPGNTQAGRNARANPWEAVDGDKFLAHQKHSKASKMSAEQLDEVRQHAEAGDGLPPAEHLQSVEASLEDAARKKMAQAVETLREAFNPMKAHVPTLEDAEALRHKLNKLAEQRKVDIRNERRHVLHEVDRLGRDREISEEERSSITLSIQHVTDEYITEIDNMIAKKIEQLTHPA